MLLLVLLLEKKRNSTPPVFMMLTVNVAVHQVSRVVFDAVWYRHPIFIWFMNAGSVEVDNVTHDTGVMFNLPDSCNFVAQLLADVVI